MVQNLIVRSIAVALAVAITAIIAYGQNFPGSFTSGSVPYFDSFGNLNQDNTNLFFNSTNKCLSVGSGASCTGTNVVNAGTGFKIHQEAEVRIRPEALEALAEKGPGYSRYPREETAERRREERGRDQQE